MRLPTQVLRRICSCVVQHRLQAAVRTLHHMRTWDRRLTGAARAGWLAIWTQKKSKSLKGVPSLLLARALLLPS